MASTVAHVPMTPSLAEESKTAPPAMDMELGKLPSSASALSLSGSTSGVAGKRFQAQGPTCLRWNIERLAVPVKKTAAALNNGNLAQLNAQAAAGGGASGPSSPGEAAAPASSSSPSSSWSPVASLMGSRGRAERNLLYKVVGQAEKGQMLALMGASGAGKSSLLDCISLRNHRFEGSVYLDDKPVDQHYFSSTGACPFFRPLCSLDMFVCAGRDSG